MKTCEARSPTTRLVEAYVLAFWLTTAGCWAGAHRVPCAIFAVSSESAVISQQKVFLKRKSFAKRPPCLCLPQELPEQWTNTKKLAIQVKQNVAPLQANEVNILRRKCQQFEVPSLGRVVVGSSSGAAAPLGAGAREGLCRCLVQLQLCPCSLAAQAARVPGELPAGGPVLLQRPQPLRVPE